MSLQDINPIKPTNKVHRILVLSLIVLLTSGIIGASTYYVMNQNAKKEKAAADKVASDLQKQIDDSNKQIRDLAVKSVQEAKKTPTKGPKEIVLEYVNLFRESQKETIDAKSYLTLSFAAQSFGNALPLGIQNSIPDSFIPTFTEKIYDDGTAYVLMKGKWGTNDFNREFVLANIDGLWRIASIKEYSPWPPESGQ